MNEELKIIIKAVTESAQDEINRLKQEIERLSNGAKGASKKINLSFKDVMKGAAIVVGSIAAIGAALVALGKSTMQFNNQMAKLTTAFQSMGASAEQATKTYNDLYRFLGDSDKAVEAAGHLAKITQNEQELAEWAKIAQGIYASFGDSLPIEGLTEAANETIRVGQVTGTLADALNWAGVSEDEFNAKLANTTSLEEREALVRTTLNGLYKDAAEIYEKNNAAILAHNESQARLDASMGAAGQAVIPLLTALNNLGAALFDVLKPALEVIIPILVNFINMITKGVQAVLSFFGALTGKSTSIKTVGSGINTATSGVKNMASGLGGAAKAAEKTTKALEEAKKVTMGFDELNIVSSGSASGGTSGGGSSGGGGGSSAPGYAGGIGGGVINPEVFETEVTESESIFTGLFESVKGMFEQLATVFEPSISAWSSAFETVKNSWETAKPSFIDGANSIKEGFTTLGTYLIETFVPEVVNSFSVNLAPVLGDLAGFTLEETALQFEAFGNAFKIMVDDVFIPVADRIKTVFTDTFGIIGNVWNEYGSPLLEQLSTAFENIRGHFENFYNSVFKPIWDKVLEVFDRVWQKGLKPLVENFVQSAMAIGTELLNLYNQVIAPVVDWIITNILPPIANFIGNIIDMVGNVATNIAEAISGIIDVIEGIVKFIVGIFTLDLEKAWEGITLIFSGAWDAIKGIFGGVGEFFGGIFSAAWNLIKDAFKAVGSFFTSVWNAIKKPFTSVATWFKGVFTKAWQGVKDVFSTGGKIFDGIKDGIADVFKTVVNGIIGGINKVIKVPFDGINSALKAIKGVDIMGLKPFDWINTIKVPQIPLLAKGGIIDAATLAVVGERGKEAVVPLENNTEWMDKLADRLAARMAAPSKIVLTLDGKELGWANIRSINNITKQTGNLPLVIV